ncbi:hypothetical protein [Acinetobacter johnsonii]|uniref:hypothetical protein n=1 Tax=Acinetobacter johnsonii TaxID=40214 RepID=UPI003F57FEB8
MNAQTQISPASQMNSVGLLNLEAFELSQRIAKMLASSTLVPEQYRAVIKVKAGKDQFGNMTYRDEENPNGLSNCVIALNMANRMGADPLMIMQNLYLIEGRPSWSSQFIMASINSCGRFSALRFELEDLGEKEVEYQETSWNNRQKQTITKKVKINNISCVAWAIERETGDRIESLKITMEMAVKEGWYGKNGSKWQTMPEQMLRYRAASFFGRVYAPELLMGLRSSEEEQDRIIDVTPQEQAVKADYSQLKREILGVKSPAELDALEELVFDIPEEAPRKELLKLVQAQAKKFQPAADVVNDQNSTSHDVAEKTITEKKPEPEKEEAPPVETIQVKKPTSAELKKSFAKALNNAKSEREVAAIESQIESSFDLSEVDKKYLASNVQQMYEKFAPEPTQSEENLSVSELQRLQKEAEKLVAQKKEAQQAPAVNEIKSSQIIGGLKIQIGNAQNITELEAVTKSIRDNKPNLTPDHMNDVLNVYAARKQFLENQLSMFDTDDIPWVDKAIAEIEAAKNQDEINNIFIDPMYEEQSDPDQQRITNAAQKRESELFGN